MSTTIMLTNYDLILLGESELTTRLQTEFERHKRVVLVRNSCFKKPFSAEAFPSTCFISQKKKQEDVFGQVVSGDFRMDLISHHDVFGKLFTNELKESEQLLQYLRELAEIQLPLAHQMITKNFGDGRLKTLRDNLKDIMKSPGTFVKLIGPGFLGGSSNMDGFLRGVQWFFAPGEYNPVFYARHLMYSLITRPAFKIDADEAPQMGLTKAEVIENTPLERIRPGSSCTLEFAGRTIAAKQVVSAVPPHILNHCGVEHFFSVPYSSCFYRFSFKSRIEPPAYMAQELVFSDQNSTVYVINRADSLSFLIPGNIRSFPDQNTLKPFFRNIMPYAVDTAEMDIEPHICPVYKSEPKTSFDTVKNFFFAKNIEYPFFGSDGEVMYLKKLREILWKRL